MNTNKTVWMAVITIFSCLLVSQELVAAEQKRMCDYDYMFSRLERNIFGRDCSLCHAMGGPWDRPGPPLNGLFEREMLMFTGEPVTEESVRKYIMEGGPRMPGFKYTLTSEEIDGLIEYLKTAHCPQDLWLEKARDRLKEEKAASEAGQ